jgi:hypothetical protein
VETKGEWTRGCLVVPKKEASREQRSCGNDRGHWIHKKRPEIDCWHMKALRSLDLPRGFWGVGPPGTKSGQRSMFVLTVLILEKNFGFEA